MLTTEIAGGAGDAKAHTAEAHTAEIHLDRGRTREELGKLGAQVGKDLTASAGRSNESKVELPGPKEEGRTGKKTGGVPERLSGSGDGAIGWMEEPRELWGR